MGRKSHTDMYARAHVACDNMCKDFELYVHKLKHCLKISDKTRVKLDRVNAILTQSLEEDGAAYAYIRAKLNGLCTAHIHNWKGWKNLRNKLLLDKLLTGYKHNSVELAVNAMKTPARSRAATEYEIKKPVSPRTRKKRLFLAAGMKRFQAGKRRRSIGSLSPHRDNAVIVPRTETLFVCKMPYCLSTAASRDRAARFQRADAVQTAEPKVGTDTVDLCGRNSFHELSIQREKIASKNLKKTRVSSKRGKSQRGKKKKSLRMKYNVKKVGKMSRKN